MEIPGTKIPVSGYNPEEMKNAIEFIFSLDGLVLSQVVNYIGIEPYMVQNWIRRGFVTSPVKKKYSKKQFSRLVIMNMLKESLSLDDIIGLLKYINGDLLDEGDDIISDDRLYYLFLNVLSKMNSDKNQDINECADKISAEYTNDEEKEKRITKVLMTMYYAYLSSGFRTKALETINNK